MYVVGNFPHQCSYIRVADKKYTIENVITGFEVLFKSFLALKCTYPDETKHIWRFIQKEIYDIELEVGKQVSSVETFIRDFTYYRTNN